MFKTAIIAITLISAVSAKAEGFKLPEGVSCNDVFWNIDIQNKETLTLKEECWLSIHRADENSGALGNKLWIRIDGKYFSVSKSKLRANFSTEEDAQKALQLEFIRQHKEWKRNGSN